MKEKYQMPIILPKQAENKDAASMRKKSFIEI